MGEGSVEDGVKDIAVDKEVLSQDPVGMELVFDAPIFDL